MTDQLQIAMIIFCCSPATTWVGQKTPVFQILFQGESRSVVCVVWSCDVCPQKHWARLTTHNVRHCMKTVLVRKYVEWLKVFGRKLSAPFFNISCIIQFFCSLWVWILSKPLVTESCCLSLLAPTSYCSLGTSTRKMTLLAPLLLLGSVSFASCGLWGCSESPRGYKGPPAHDWNAGREQSACRQVSYPHPILSYLWEIILEIRLYMLYFL